MKNFETLKPEADRLRKSKKYDQALPIYGEMWDNFHDQCNEWDGLNYAFCLKQQKKYHDALVVCKEVYEKYPDFENIRCSYAWCLYYIYIAPKIIRKEDIFLEKAELITNLTVQSDPSGIYIRTVLKVLDYLMSLRNTPVANAIVWCEKVDSDELNPTPFFMKKNGEVIEFSSEKEHYIAIKLKLLHAIKDYEACLEVCEEAFEEFDILHEDNYITFRYIAADCYIHFDMPEKALERYQEIIEVLPTPRYLNAIANLLYKLDRKEEAMKYAIQGALAGGTPDKKIGIFKLLAQLFEDEGKLDIAKLHLQQIYAVFRAKKMQPDEALLKWIDSYDIRSEYIDFKRMSHDLQLCWESIKYADKERFEGRIKNILPNGKSGFIETNDSKNFYFTFNNLNINPQAVYIGMPVSFLVMEAYDTKHDRTSEVAFAISGI